MNFILFKTFSSLSSNEKKALVNSLTLIASQLLKYSINLFLSVWIVRYLGAELFGSFSYVLAMSAIFGVFANLGLQPIVVREIIKSPDQLKDILGTSITLTFLSGCISYIILLFIISLLNHDNAVILYLTALNALIFIFDPLRLISCYYEANVESRKVVKISNYVLVFTSTLKYLCVYFDLGIYLLCFIYALEVLLNSIFLYFLFLQSSLGSLKFRIIYPLACKLLKSSYPLIMSSFMVSLFMKIDQVMINTFLGSKSSGIFSVSVRLTEIFYFIPVVIQSTLFPNIMAIRDNNVIFRSRLNDSYSINIIFSYLVIIIMILFSETIIKYLYGNEFLGAISPFMISIWALLFVSIGIARNSFIMTHNLTNVYMIITFIAAVMNILLNLFLIPKYGIVGAAISTLIAQFFAGYFSGIFFKPLRYDFIQVTKKLFFPKLEWLKKKPSDR